ncbi:MAG: hypothetical protein GH148_03440 [Clostridia bacterium]|nr:hypothetical protein [Clostridia bacterium]
MNPNFQIGLVFGGKVTFHSESKPSFTVYTDIQSFYCYGYGVGGDIIAIIIKIEEIGFKEAISRLNNMI